MRETGENPAGAGGETFKVWASLKFYGPFAVAAEGPFTDMNRYGRGALERCGATLHIRINDFYGSGASPVRIFQGPTIGTSHVIIWQSGPQQLAGIFIPSIVRFTLTLPTFVHGIHQLAISNRTLYVLDQRLQLWSTASPFHTP